MTAVTVMSTKLRAAVESTIEKRHAAGAACFAGPPLDLDRFVAAIMNPLEGQAAHLTQTLPYRLIPIMGAQHRRPSGSNP